MEKPERQWMDYPKDIEISTSFGPVYLSIVRGDYVYVDAAGNGKFIMVAGKKYALSLRLMQRDGRPWELQADAQGNTWDAVHARKYQCYERNDRMPDSYQAKAVNEILATVSAYLDSHPKQLRQAAVADVNNELASAEKDLVELEAKAAEQRALVSKLRKTLSRAEMQLAVATAGSNAEVR